MKTVYDLSAFLRRNENLQLTVHYDGKRFHVSSPSVAQHAAYLSDALGYVQEEYARRANGMEPIRDDGKGKAGDCAVAPTVNAFTSTGNKPIALAAIRSAMAALKGSIYAGTATPATAPTPAPQYPTCPTCGALPRGWTNASAWCGSSHVWPFAFVIGSRVQGDSINAGRVFEYDGTQWNVVTP